MSGQAIMLTALRDKIASQFDFMVNNLSYQ